MSNFEDLLDSINESQRSPAITSPRLLVIWVGWVYFLTVKLPHNENHDCKGQLLKELNHGILSHFDHMQNSSLLS